MSVTQRKDCYQLRKAGYQMTDACELCGSAENLVIDHITALSQGGTNDLDNLRTLCQSCNTKQGWANRPRPELEKYTTYLRPETIQAIKLYAVQHRMKDYEVVQLAFDQLFSQTKEG